MAKIFHDLVISGWYSNEMGIKIGTACFSYRENGFLGFTSLMLEVYFLEKEMILVKCGIM